MPYSILISLSPTGLQLELPTPTPGRTRTVPLREGHEVETITRVLRAGPGPLDTQGAPTRALARHWQFHKEWPDEHCVFCKAEGKTFKHNGPRYRDLGNGVKVRKLTVRGKDDIMKLELDL